MRLRVIAALVALPIALAVLLANSTVPLLILSGLLMGVATEEWMDLFKRRCEWSRLAASLFFVSLALLAITTTPSKLGTIIVVLGAVQLLGLIGIVATLRLGHLGWAGLIASLWVSVPLASLILLHLFGAPQTDGLFALNAVLLPIVPLWAGDTAAIFAGKAYGKHPLAPSISPNKTWEGAIANLVACSITGLLLGPLLRVGWPLGLSCGVLCGVLGQAGDLTESALKRRIGLKDSGSFLPGHGGLLDRLDSLLFTALPVTALILLWPG